MYFFVTILHHHLGEDFLEHFPSILAKQIQVSSKPFHPKHATGTAHNQWMAGTWPVEKPGAPCGVNRTFGEPSLVPYMFFCFVENFWLCWRPKKQPLCPNYWFGAAKTYLAGA